MAVGPSGIPGRGPGPAGALAWDRDSAAAPGPAGAHGARRPSRRVVGAARLVGRAEGRASPAALRWHHVSYIDKKTLMAKLVIWINMQCLSCVPSNSHAANTASVPEDRWFKSSLTTASNTGKSLQCDLPNAPEPDRKSDERMFSHRSCIMGDGAPRGHHSRDLGSRFLNGAWADR